MAEPEPVSVRDLEVADRIARAVKGGRPADSTPTVEQVLAAFGEAEPTLDARRRAARALALAGVATMPDLLEVAPGQRVTLEVRRVRGRRRALLLGILALVALFAAAVALSTQVDLGDDKTAADLPAGTTSTAPAPTTATNTVTQEPTTSTSTSTAAKPPATAAERRRAKRIRERRARAKRARARRARARRARARAAAKRRVTVRLAPRLATFLCVEGDGKQLFNGTLSAPRTFRGRVVRLNVGLGPSTRVTANGKVVPLTASPTGLQLTPKGRTFLPLGARPCA